ncbi:MAG: DUF1667 domain-containing protein [Lachnospiraceae bacterium]|nr:DUF1667 domain-containing protein [Lachnospiraceae bacterium]
MAEKKELVCIGCPKGCVLTVTMESGNVKEICGNTCPKGEDYARKEMLDPRRTVTSTVRVVHGVNPVVAVKTKEDIPKDKIFACMEALREVRVEAPVYVGDIILENVAGTGIAVVATGEVQTID